MAKSFDIAYRFKAIDNFTSVGEKITGSIDKIKSSIKDVNNSTKLSQSSFKKFGDTIGNFGDKLKSLGSKISTRVSLPLAALGANMIRLANIQAQAESRLITGLDNYLGKAKFTFESLTKMASDLQNKSLFGDEEIIAQVTVPLLRFQEIGADQFIRAQQAIIDISAGTGRGLSTVGVQVARALNEPLRALTTLERLGIDFNIPNLNETLKKLTESGRQLDAQSLVLTILEKQFKGSAENLTKIGSGPLKQLWMRLGDISEKIGDEILIILKPLLDKLKEIAKAFESLTPGQRRLIAWGILLGSILGPVLIALGAFLLLIKGLAIGFAVLSIAASPVILTILAIAAALGLGYIAGKFLRKFFEDKFPNAIKFVGDKIKWLDEKISNLRDSIANFFKKDFLIGGLIRGFGGLFNKFNEFSAKSEDFVFNKIKDLDLGKVANTFDATFIPGDIKSSGGDTFNNLFPLKSSDKDSSEVTINLKSPTDIIDSIQTKATGRSTPKVGWQMVDG